VFCEKPPALNAGDVGQMVEAAKKAGRTLMFNFNNRARPESYAMREYFKSGAVGRVNSAQAQWIRRNGIPGFGGWFTTKKLSGGGPLIDLLHMVDLALHFMGYPEPSYVLGQTFTDNIDNKEFKGPWGIPDVKDGITDVEAAAHALVTFKSGQVLMLRNSWAEMNEREVVSVVFQGQKAGGKVQRLFRVVRQPGLAAQVGFGPDLLVLGGDTDENLDLSDTAPGHSAEKPPDGAPAQPGAQVEGLQKCVEAALDRYRQASHALRPRWR